MSIGNAMKFIKKVDNDASFRKSLYQVQGWDGLSVFLNSEDLTYSAGEFEEAFNHMHTQCQEAEDADRLYNVRNLVNLIINANK